jgi:3-oxoacyl-[acyl-carrier-protein] synthase III
MNSPVITAVAAWVPDAISLARWSAIESALRVIGHFGWDTWMRSWHPDYGHWLEAWPAKETGSSLAMHHTLPPPDMDVMVPVETGTDLSGLAAKMANTICAARQHSARPVDIIMFCHSSLDENVSTTTAGRLCAELGLSCFPFSVSQQQGASVFTALRLAADLFIAEPDVHTILIVAAEKWRPPFSRLAGPDIVLGDAAGALLVERTSHRAGGLQLLDASTRRVPADTARRATAASDARTVALLSMIEFLLARHCLRHDEIDEIVGHPGLPSLTGAVCNLLDRLNTEEHHQHCVHLGAAESIVRLAQTLSRAACRRTHRVLLWGFGIGGFVGAALLESHGAPSIYQQDDVRSVS